MASLEEDAVEEAGTERGEDAAAKEVEEQAQVLPDAGIPAEVDRGGGTVQGWIKG